MILLNYRKRFLTKVMEGMMKMMKKILLSVLTFCLTCCIVSIQSVNASTDLTDSYLNAIKEQVCLLSEEIEISKLNFKDYRILLDIENNESYALIVTDNNGYIISGIKNKTVSEYSLIENSNPYKNNMNDTLLYYGPMNYLFKSNGSIVDIYSNQIISSNLRMNNVTDNNIENLFTNFPLTWKIEFFNGGFAIYPKNQSYQNEQDMISKQKQIFSLLSDLMDWVEKLPKS